MLTYYDFDASPNCLKTKILLFELGIPHEQRSVDHTILRGAEYRARFPTGMAPAIEDGDLRMSESGAIALYLAEKHGALTPRDPRRRALMFQAMSLEAALLAPTVGGQGLFGELYKPEAERNERRIAELRAKTQWVAQVLGTVLGEREFFAEEFSIADIQLYAATAKTLERAEPSTIRRRTSSPGSPAWASVQRWRARARRTCTTGAGKGAAGGRAHSLTAPAVAPAMMCLLKKRYRARAGRATMTMQANWTA